MINIKKGIYVTLLLGWLVIIFISGVYAKTIIVSPEMSLEEIGQKIQDEAVAGDIIKFEPGLYRGTLHLKKLNGLDSKPIILSGEPGVIIDARTEEDLQENKYGGSSIILEKSSNITIENFELTGGQRGITLGYCNNITIRNNKIHHIRNYGIMNYKTNNTKIINNYIAYSEVEHGIYISASAKDILIKDNYIRDTHINGIHINGEIDGVTIEGNILYRSGKYPSPAGGAGITVINGARNIKIINNSFLDIHGQGFTLLGKDIIIKNNLIKNTRWSVILVKGEAENITFTNNIVIEESSIPLQIEPTKLTTINIDNNFYILGSEYIYLDINTYKKYKPSEWIAKGFDKNSIFTRIKF